jgi:hypothetical protein
MFRSLLMAGEQDGMLPWLVDISDSVDMSRHQHPVPVSDYGISKTL